MISQYAILTKDTSIKVVGWCDVSDPSLYSNTSKGNYKKGLAGLRYPFNYLEVYYSNDNSVVADMNKWGSLEELRAAPKKTWNLEKAHRVWGNELKLGDRLHNGDLVISYLSKDGDFKLGLFSYSTELFELKTKRPPMMIDPVVYNTCYKKVTLSPYTGKWCVLERAAYTIKGLKNPQYRLELKLGGETLGECERYLLVNNNYGGLFIAPDIVPPEINPTKKKITQIVYPSMNLRALETESGPIAKKYVCVEEYDGLKILYVGGSASSAASNNGIILGSRRFTNSSNFLRFTDMLGGALGVDDSEIIRGSEKDIVKFK